MGSSFCLLSDAIIVERVTIKYEVIPINIKKLKEYETRFYMRYPNGWESEALQATLKKHNVGKMESFAQEVLSEDGLRHELEAMKGIVKLISRSSLVSVFEKVKFKNLIAESDDLFQREIVDTIRIMLHENEALGFERLAALLSPYKMAKWPIITVLLTYYQPKKQVFVKPTTVKAIIRNVELTNLTYTPKVNYSFYREYRDAFLTMTSHVNKELSKSNGHFSGFLMMTME